MHAPRQHCMSVTNTGRFAPRGGTDGYPMALNPMTPWSCSSSSYSAVAAADLLLCCCCCSKPLGSLVQTALTHPREGGQDQCSAPHCTSSAAPASSRRYTPPPRWLESLASSAARPPSVQRRLPIGLSAALSAAVPLPFCSYNSAHCQACLRHGSSGESSPRPPRRCALPPTGPVSNILFSVTYIPLFSPLSHLSYLLSLLLSPSSPLRSPLLSQISFSPLFSSPLFCKSTCQPRYFVRAGVLHELACCSHKSG